MLCLNLLQRKEQLLTRVVNIFSEIPLKFSRLFFVLFITARALYTLIFIEAYKNDILLTVLQSALYIQFEVDLLLLGLFVETVAKCESGKIGFNLMTVTILIDV